MKLLIDAGNTCIKWALVNRDEWLRSGVMPIEQAVDLPQVFPDCSDIPGTGLYDIQQVWVSNVAGEEVARHIRNICLLYTSDAADDLLCVDLGGRRIIKKKK